MPACENCGADDFECIDGMFYCVECETQSQTFQDEQAPDLLADGTFTTRQLKKKKHKEKSDYGRIWYSVEGYQLVIKAHINALIKIGIDPKLDVVMKQIWFKYVHKTNMASIDSCLPTDSVPESFLSLRDYYFKHCSKDDAAVSSRKVKLRFSRESKKKGKQLDSDSEWFSVDTEASSAEEDRLSSSSCPSIGQKKRKRHPRSWCMMKTMSLGKVIAFCYISFRWMGELFTIGDLIHWAESGRIPYYDAGGCFPNDMKLYQGDDRTFVHARLLQYHEIVFLSRRLHNYIKMPDLPPVNILALVGRYLHQLNLPLGLIPLAHRILETINKANWANQSMTHKRRTDLLSSKLPDMIAAAVIIIVLKTCFVLDGDKEWRNNVEMDEICFKHSAHADSCSPFSWRKWVIQQLNYTSASSSTFNDRSLSDNCFDLDTCMEHYMNVILKGHSYKTERICKNKVNAKEFMEARQAPFKRLVQLQGSSEIINEKRLQRVDGSDMIKLFGYRGKFCPGNLTSSCVHLLLKSLANKEESDYIPCRNLTGTTNLESLPHSYAFVLSLFTDVTKADWELIHDYVSYAEMHLFETDKFTHSSSSSLFDEIEE